MRIGMQTNFMVGIIIMSVGEDNSPRMELAFVIMAFVVYFSLEKGLKGGA